MTIEAKIIADSISAQNIRITTFQLRYPRFIHAEELTHRILESQPELIISEVIPDGLMYDQNLSRNASSSRAIPVERLIADIIRDPVIPTYWGSNKPGMQAGEELSGQDLIDAKNYWIDAMHLAIGQAQKMVGVGLHKQIANRILEPWAHINVVVTATDYENFFALRRHEDAQPEIKALADAMWLARANNVPEPLIPGEWHLPYVDHDSWVKMKAIRKENRVTRDEPSYNEMAEQLKRVSVARCARVSYLTHDGRETTLEEDIALYERLVGSHPLHASPAEHQATPDGLAYLETSNHPRVWANPKLHGNFNGWIQFRKQLPGEFTPG